MLLLLLHHVVVMDQLSLIMLLLLLLPLLLLQQEVLNFGFSLRFPVKIRTTSVSVCFMVGFPLSDKRLR